MHIILNYFNSVGQQGEKQLVLGNGIFISLESKIPIKCSKVGHDVKKEFPMYENWSKKKNHNYI